MQNVPAYKREWVSRALIEEPLRRAADFFVLERMNRFERRAHLMLGGGIPAGNIRTYALVASADIFKRRLLSGKYSISVKPVADKDLTETRHGTVPGRSFEATIRVDSWELKNTYWEDDMMEYLYRRAVLKGTELFTTILEYERIRTMVEKTLSLFGIRKQGWEEPQWKRYLDGKEDHPTYM